MKIEAKITDFDIDWKKIKGVDSFYEINNLGQVRNQKGQILKTSVNSGGYEVIALRKDKIKKQLYIHRLVAKAFLDNPNNYKEINHKDENKLNNKVENLEWCNRKYNAVYGTKLERQRVANPLKKKVEQYSLTNELINVWQSITLASKKTGINRANIVQCLRGNGRKTAGGYKWKEITNEN
jgi:uncharacterized protein YijF (DUF1287 family)